MNKQNLTLVLTAVRDIIDRHSCQCNVAAPIHTYGITWECGSTSPACTRIGDSATFEDPSPAVGTGSGASPFDTLMPWAGMVRSTDANAGEVVAIPKYGYRINKDGNALSIEIADGAKDGFSVSPAHMDRGDGKGERDVVYVGRYHCGTGDSEGTTAGSVSGKVPQVNGTRAQCRQAIHALGDNVWQMDYATYWTIAMLYLVEFANWDSQAVIGYGCGNGDATVASGYTDSMTYHTGTNLSSRTSYGNGVQYRWIEGWWDNVADWIDGYYQSNLAVNIIMNPAEFSDTEGGVAIGNVSEAMGYITDWAVPDVDGYSWAMLPSGFNADNPESPVGGGDMSVFDSVGVVLNFGGDFRDQNPFYGLFSLIGDSRASNAGNLVGARLLVLP
mgnify:FL=1